MDAWTIFSTFIVGVGFGFFGLCGVVLYFIHLDDEAKALKKAASEYAARYNVTPELALQIIKNHPVEAK